MQVPYISETISVSTKHKYTSGQQYTKSCVCRTFPPQSLFKLHRQTGIRVHSDSYLTRFRCCNGEFSLVKCSTKVSTNSAALEWFQRLWDTILRLIWSFFYGNLMILHKQRIPMSNIVKSHPSLSSRQLFCCCLVTLRVRVPTRLCAILCMPYSSCCQSYLSGTFTMSHNSCKTSVTRHITISIIAQRTSTVKQQCGRLLQHYSSFSSFFFSYSTPYEFWLAKGKENRGLVGRAALTEYAFTLITY